MRATGASGAGARAGRPSTGGAGRATARGALLFVLAATSCNVVEWTRERHARTFAAAGLRPREALLGADRVRFWEGGRGPMVVLVHGFGADAIWQWHPQVGALAARHRLLVPDLLWFGGSQSSERDFSVGHQARMLLALLRHAGVERADFVGISYGGLVVHELARHEPQAVVRLVLVDSPGRAYTREDYRALCRRFAVDHIAELLLPEDVEGVKRLTALAYEDPPWTPDFAARQVLRELYPFRREKRALIDSLLRELEAARPATALGEKPTLLLWGRNDPVFPLALAERLALALGPRVKLWVLDRTRHAPNLELPEEFNRMLLTFLAAAPPR